MCRVIQILCLGAVVIFAQVATADVFTAATQTCTPAGSDVSQQSFELDEFGVGHKGSAVSSIVFYCPMTLVSNQSPTYNYLGISYSDSSTRYLEYVRGTLKRVHLTSGAVSTVATVFSDDCAAGSKSCVVQMSPFTPNFKYYAYFFEIVVFRYDNAPLPLAKMISHSIQIYSNRP